MLGLGAEGRAAARRAQQPKGTTGSARGCVKVPGDYLRFTPLGSPWSASKRLSPWHRPVLQCVRRVGTGGWYTGWVPGRGSTGRVYRVGYYPPTLRLVLPGPN